jgi:hypothetical protein
MGYRIRVVPEVEVWLGELRESDPGSARLVDEAVDALREGGAGLGPPLVVPVEVPAGETWRDPDQSDRQFQMLTRTRRAVADAATTRKRLELQMQRLEEQVGRLAGQRAKASQIGRDDLAAVALDRSRGLQARLEDLSREHAEALTSEERLSAASQRSQSGVDAFRIRQRAVSAADEASSRELSELRPGAPATAGSRILFAVKPPDTAILLAAGTERDWLRTWYAVMIRHCRVRYERDQGSAG